MTPAAVYAADAMLGGVENRTAVSPVFVGRRQELAGLTDALDRADDGTPQALLVGGEAGVGKTRLLEEFLAAARRRGAVTAVGGCLELGADGLPFAPFATALRSLHRTLGDAGLAAAVAGHEAELARLLPDLATAPAADGDLTPAGESEDGRARLFELTALLLERLAAERTVVLALEDLHWADRSTRELLGYLFRSLQSARLVLVATYRADDIHRRHPLRPFLAETDRLRTVRRVELPRLTRGEVRAQIAGIQGVTDPEAELVETVFDRTDGNPFFVEELTENCATCGISDSLRDLLLVRVEALPESAQQVVRLAAQGGSTVEHALLAAVCPLPETDLLDALRAAVGANVLLPTEDGEGYRFRHALLREAVDDDLLPGEGARLSRRYAQALEADPELVRRPEVRATRLAHYWYRGRDAAKALPAVLAASVEARSRHAFAEQHQLLERALGLWDQAPQEVRAALRPVDHADAYPACAADAADDSLRFMDLLAETVVAARTGGELDRALVLARRALELLDERADPQRAAWFRGQTAILLEDLGRSGGLRELERAQQVLRGLPPTAVQAQILSLEAGWSMLYHPGPEALATAERAVELARLTGAQSAELRSRVVLGVLILDSGNTERGLEEMARARDQALSLGEFGAALNAEVNMAGELAAVGRVTDALTVAENAARTALEHGRADLCAYALADQAWVWLSLGDWTRADQLITEARTHVRAADARAWLEILTATLALQRGDHAGLESALKTAYDLVGGHPAQPKQPQQAIPLHWLATALHAERGEVAAARDEVGRALDEGFPPGQHRNAWPLLLTAAAFEARVRGLPSADAGRARMLARLTESAGNLPRPAPLWEAHSLLLHAQLARAGGEDDPAVWARAVAALESLEHPYLLAQARAGQAEALLGASGAGRADARREVADLLGKAHAAADRLGARPLVAEVAQLAARAGVPLGAAGSRAAEQSAAPDPAESFGLTPRERAVLELVAAGRSNRQIAQSLYISPKTASVHVSNILAKLGVAGRTEAAAMAHRLRLVVPTGVPAGG